jgi:sulfur-oxidizing protein SoxY
MNRTRRKLILGTGATGALALATAAGLMQAGAARAIELKPTDYGFIDFESVMNEIGGLKAQVSGGISIVAPDLADQGALVPVEVISLIPGTDSIAILVEKNAIPLVGKFEFKNGGVGRIATRIKMAESSPVHVVVRAGGQIYRASKSVSVVIGGCEESAPSPMKLKTEK